MPAFNKSTSYIDQISKNGFALNDDYNRMGDYSYLSLRGALIAYFRTYQSYKWGWHIFKDYPNKVDKNAADLNTPTSYKGEVFQTIVLFQHFFEIALKEILRNEHPALAGDTSNKPDVFYKLLKNIPLTAQDLGAVQSAEFSKVLNTACQLIKDEHLAPATYGFIPSARKALETVNNLRNRLWHRGVFVLRYPALDELVGGHILPLVIKFTSLPEFSAYERIWKYRPLHCGLDPISEIINEFDRGSYDLPRTALLKEMARSAYEAPVRHKDGKSWMSIGKDAEVERAQEIAAMEQNSHRVIDCPVCGTKSLVQYHDSETIDEQYAEDGELIGFGGIVNYIYEVKCFCCTFNVSQLKNPNEYGLNAPDLFEFDY